MKQKAAIISYSYFLRDARVRRYTQALHNNRYDLDVFSLREKFLKKYPYNFFLFPIPRFRLGLSWYFVEYLFFFIFTLLIISVKSIFFKRYKLVQVFNLPDFIVFATVIPKLLGAKIIIDVRDLAPELFLTKYSASKNSFFYELLSFLEEKSLHYSDLIISANPLFKDMLIKKYPNIKDKIFISYETADQKIFYQKEQRKTNNIFNVLYIGTIEKRFNIEMIIESIKILYEEIPQIRLTIIPKIENEGKYLEFIKNKIEENQLKAKIIIKNPMPLERIAEEIRNSDAGIILVEKDPYTDIIFRTKLYEFISCKVPVIATKTKFLSSNFSEKQIAYLSKNSPAELAKIIIKIYKDKKYSDTLSRNAYKYFKHYNWKNEEVNYIKIITQS